MNLHCKKCLTGRSDDVLGAPCRTDGCDGVIEEQPAFSTLVDELPETMTCGRRVESGMDDANSPFVGAGKGLDRWLKFKSNGNRVCSYCGSLHPDDFLEMVRQSAAAPLDAEYDSVPGIEPSDKSYKIYVRQPGVRNAHEGGIKFYTHHLPRDDAGKLALTQAQHDEYAEAQLRSHARFERHMATFLGGDPHKVRAHPN